MSIEFFIEFNLVSTNERDIVARGRKILSPKYRQCLAALVSEFSNHEKEDLPEGPYKITVQSYAYADYDNYLKLIGDALEKAGVITNDREILKADITKFRTKRGHDQSHFIRIEHYETAK